MEVIFLKQAQEDLKQIKKSGDIILQNKITRVLKDIKNSPFSGIGKPEPLKHNLSGWWSRRLTTVHRIVYKLDEDNNICILSLLYHYPS